MQVSRLQVILPGVLISLCMPVLLAAGNLYPARRIRQELDRILAGSEYTQAEYTWLRKLMRRLGEWLQDLFGGFEPDISSLYAARPILYWAIVAFLVILLCVLIYHIILTVKFALQGPRAKKRTAFSGELLSPEILRDRAIGLAEKGQFMEALRLLYEASLRQLDRLELLRYDPARTGSENLAALGDKHHLLAFMKPLNQNLEGFFYGGQQVTSTDFQVCLALANQAWELKETV